MPVSQSSIVLAILHLHWSKPVKREKEEHEPEYRIDCLDRELLGAEEQGEERDVTSDCKWSKSSKMTSIFEGQEAEWDDDQKNSFLMHMPAKEK